MRIALPLLAARLTQDALLISIVAALALLPWLFFAIPAGILIDRIDRRRALALAQAVRVMLAVLLFVLILTNALTIWWIYLIVFVYGAFETVYDGAIRAVVPSIVGKADLPRANSRIEAGELVVQNFLSGPLTSLLFAVSALIPVGINGLVFALAGGLALALPKAASGRQFAEAADEPAVKWHRQFLDGFRFIISSRMLVTLWLFSTFVGIVTSAATASWVLFVLERLEVPEALFGVFMLSGAVGGILGAMLTSRLKSAWGAGLTMAIMSVIDGVVFLFAGLVPTVWAAAIAFAISSGVDHDLEHPGDVDPAELHPRPAARAGARHVAHAAVGIDAARLAHRRAARAHRPHRAAHRRRCGRDRRERDLLPVPDDAAEPGGHRQR